MTMKEFNLEDSKNGKEVCTRDGRAARIICYDRKASSKYSTDVNIIALITDENNVEVAYYYDNNGKFCECKESKNDLVMKSTKHEGWVNIYKNINDNYSAQRIYKTKEEAVEFGQAKKCYITTTKIEWEE